MMPDVVADRSAGVDYAVCGDCLGTTVDIDSDGSLSGVLGAVIPCCCLLGDGFGQSPLCGCHVHEAPAAVHWEINGGFTGWLAVPLDLRDDDETPMLRPCPVHAPLSPATLAAAVAVSR